MFVSFLLFYGFVDVIVKMFGELAGYPELCLSRTVLRGVSGPILRVVHSD